MNFSLRREVKFNGVTKQFLARQPTDFYTIFQIYSIRNRFESFSIFFQKVALGANISNPIDIDSNRLPITFSSQMPIQKAFIFRLHTLDALDLCSPASFPAQMNVFRLLVVVGSRWYFCFALFNIRNFFYVNVNSIHGKNKYCVGIGHQYQEWAFQHLYKLICFMTSLSLFVSFLDFNCSLEMRWNVGFWYIV